ncbi:hypothetical protein UFOVP45_37 [uncultured Caudovirales phage]|uniref:Uncharacterized protein n=1 Tax=uncultured Caudovirales phage TaxID=2100421 RepID=A0A6J5KUL5_9CAUD|nr:hypothetical protein UFOVP45_37 [uncultured Caudovirales phage]
MTFILSEDKAIRERLQTVTVTDQKAEGEGTPRQVGVWFGQPDQELRTQNYPYITIDLINIQRDAVREMRMDYHAPTYLQPEGLAANQHYVLADNVPVNLTYQITTYARHPRHDRQILSQLMGQTLPLRFGSLNIDDNTVRRLDVLSISKRDTVEAAKRLFVNAVTVQVSSEIPQGTLETLYQVSEVHIDNPTPENAGGRNGFPYFSGVGPDIITA